MSHANRPSEAGLQAAAWLLLCDVPALCAVVEVESGKYGAFLPSGEPVILFERHVFSRLTNRRHDGHRVFEVDPEDGLISAPTAGGYGPISIQHLKLQAATLLDRSAALKSCSWGLFQIMGENHTQAGYPQLQRFINAMYRSADDHLRAFVMFIRHDSRLVDALRDHDWTSFARIYNGPKFAESGYDRRIAAAYLQQPQCFV